MKIAVSVDNSNASKEALVEAIKFAELTEGELILVHSVEENVSTEQEGLVREGENTAIQRGEELLDKLEKKVKSDSDVTVGTELLATDNGTIEGILDYIDDEDIEYVYIGHRGLKGKHEKLFGSFAKDMISKSDIPVVVV